MTEPVAATGVAGLDDILNGGLTPNRLYLLEGMPGSGKTTLAFQFLMEGVRRGEPVLYVTLSETAEEIRAVAARSAEHTSELQSQSNLVCRLLLENKNGD